MTLTAETAGDKPGVLALGISIGMMIPFVVIFAVAALLWVIRRLRQVLLYATPKHLERRINLAAQFVDARRAYRVGGSRAWVALCVGRQWRHHDQAAAVLLDEFLPTPEPTTRRGAR